MKQNGIALFFLSLFILSCSNPDSMNGSTSDVERLKLVNDSLVNVVKNREQIVDNRMLTSLTFQDGRAETAMNFYVDLFENSRITDLKRWGENGPVEAGLIMQARFELNGNLFMCSDSPPVHEWDFTPAVSNYIECKNESELERLFSELSENGQVTMPPNNYGFSQKFAWVIDQFGVSWQLNLQ